MGEEPLSAAGQDEIRRLLRAGQNVSPIKRYRELTQCGLAESLQWVNEFIEREGVTWELTAAGPPCPSCGKPLRTSLAQQCLSCGNDWHGSAKLTRPGLDERSDS